jgi:hypothetical protein
MNVSSNLVPDVSITITSGTNPICSGVSVTFAAAPINGGTSPAYQWKVNGTNVGTNSPTFTTSTLANGQIVTCVLTSSATCASPATVTSTTITQNLSVLTSSASAGNQWYLNGVIIPGATNQSYTCTVNGSYTVVVTLNGCTSATSAAIVMTNVTIYEVNNNLGLSIFPNPNLGEFTISFYSEIKSNYKIEIYSSLGQQVYLKVVNEFKGSYSKQINLSEFGKGVYTIKITNSKFETNKKIIVY